LLRKQFTNIKVAFSQTHININLFPSRLYCRLRNFTGSAIRLAG